MNPSSGNDQSQISMGGGQWTFSIIINQWKEKSETNLCVGHFGKAGKGKELRSKLHWTLKPMDELGWMKEVVSQVGDGTLGDLVNCKGRASWYCCWLVEFSQRAELMNTLDGDSLLEDEKEEEEEE